MAAGFARTLKGVGKYRWVYLMFLPVALYFVLFSYYPFLKGIVMSFQENRILGPRPFVGIANYAQVVQDMDFRQTLVNSIVIGFTDMVLYFVLSLGLALSINELASNAARKTIQTLVYIPYLFSWAVIAGVWVLIFDERGLVNSLGALFGYSPKFFLAEPDLAQPLIIAMGVWRSIGYYSLLFAVAITGIDPTLFEVARIDGAGRLEQIRMIIIPSLYGTMKVIAVLLIMGVLTHFDEMYVMQNPANKQHIRTLLLYIYETGILNFKAGFATAGAVLVMIGTLVLVFVMRKLIRYDAL